MASIRSGAMGRPMLTNTGNGRRWGCFQRYFCPEKENMEPQRRSRNTGTTGTAALRATISKPLRISISTPVRLICPSGKMHTSSPAVSRSTACLMAAVAWRGATEITPVT